MARTDTPTTDIPLVVVPDGTAPVRGPLVKYRVVQDALVFRTGNRDQDVLVFKNGDVLELFSNLDQTKNLLTLRALAPLEDAPERVRATARQVAFALGGLTDTAMEHLPIQPDVPLLADTLPVPFPEV